MYTRPSSPSSTTSNPIQVTLYEGQYGFGNTSSLTSPGPSLTFIEGQKYTVTVHNVGTIPHSWKINTQNTTIGQVLFNTEINPGTYIAPGQSGSVTFTPTQTSNFYYICPLPDHAALGMWGIVVVTSNSTSSLTPTPIPTASPVPTATPLPTDTAIPAPTPTPYG